MSKAPSPYLKLSIFIAVNVGIGVGLAALNRIGARALVLTMLIFAALTAAGFTCLMLYERLKK